MIDPRRTSRADRRRNNPQPDPWADRRQLPPLECRVESDSDGDSTVIRVQSVLVASNEGHAREQFRAHAARNPAGSVVVDLSNCPYIDTAGLTSLFELKKVLAAADRPLCLRNPSRAVLRLLNLTNTTRIFPVETTNSDQVPISVSRGSATGTSVTPNPDVAKNPPADGRWTGTAAPAALQPSPARAEPESGFPEDAAS